MKTTTSAPRSSGAIFWKSWTLPPICFCKWKAKRSPWPTQKATRTWPRHSQNLFNCIFENCDALVANPVEVLYVNWGVGDLVGAKTGSGIVTDTMESLNNIFYHNYNSKLEAMDQEYQNKTGSRRTVSFHILKNQKHYLKRKQTLRLYGVCDNFFSSQDYSQAQALEIQPLVIAYKSNLVAQSQNAAGMQKGQLMGVIAQVGFLENDVNRILNPQPQPQPKVQVPQPTVAKTIAVEPTATNATEIVTNVITVNKFFPIPLDSLYHPNDGEQFSGSSATITAHHWFEEKLLLDFRYGVSMESRDGKGILMDARTVAGDAIGIFDPATEHWSIVDCPESDAESYILSQNNFYHRSVLLHGELFTCDEKQIKKYDFKNQQWKLLSISDGNNYEMFAVNGHLYAANQNTIFEILNGGMRTHILASNRRQPPASSLDTENLGTPTLFAGPRHSLRAAAGNKIVAWSGEDWRMVCSAPQAPMPPVISDTGVLFLADGWNASAGAFGVWQQKATMWNSASVQEAQRGVGTVGSSPSINSKPRWILPPEFSLPRLPVASRGSDLYLAD